MTEGTHLYGDRAPHNLQYVVLVASANLTQERVLTGTANQITITDNGAGGTVVLSIPSALTIPGTLDSSFTNTVAAGDSLINVHIIQSDDTALTGTLRGAYITASNGDEVATGTIRGVEIKARAGYPGEAGANVNVLEGFSVSSDAKTYDVTTHRGGEIILDGGAGTSTLAVGLRIANNFQANRATTSYALEIYRDSFDYTADIYLSSGGLIGGSGGDLFVTDAGNVGIGTAGPESTFHVVSNVITDAPTIIYEQEGNYLQEAMKVWSSDHVNHAGSFLFYRARGTEGTPVAVVSGDQLGGFGFRGWDGDQFLQPAFFGAFVDGAVSDNVVPVQLRFYTGTLGGSVRMTIQSNGNINIGTTEAIAKLHVGSGTGVAGWYDGATEDGLLVDPGSATTTLGVIASNQADLILFDSGNVGDQGMFRLQSAGEKTHFQILNDAFTALEREIVTFDNSDGKVGIGVTDPHSLLEVAGAISSATSTFSTAGPTDNVDVAGINTLFIDCSSNNVTIGGFINGVSGQVLRVTRLCASAFTATLEHAEAHAFQKIYLHAKTDESLQTEWGGWNLVCNGSDWFDPSHAKHVA